MSKKIFEAGDLTVWQMEPEDPDYDPQCPFYFEGGEVSLSPMKAMELAAVLNTHAFPMAPSSRNPIERTTTPFMPKKDAP